jgi:hypothetical protein
MSRSVAFRRSGTRSRLPGGTVVGGHDQQCGSQDIQRGVPIPVQHKTTGRTEVGAHRKGFLDAIATPRAILRGEARRNGDNGDAMDLSVVAHPEKEQPPTGITDALCQMVILDEMGNLEVFIGNQIARFDQRTRSLRCKVFTLPLHLEIAFCQALNRLLSIPGPLDLARDAPMQAFQFGLCLAETSGDFLPSGRPSRCRNSSVRHQCPPVCLSVHG